jgi:aminoglycoside 6'-N-acetyltransferase I
MAQTSEISIEKCDERDLADWITLRRALWPEAAEEDLCREAEALIRRPDRAIALLARIPTAAPIGFVEATLRNEYVNGCATSPVAFIEGIYVHPEWRRRGIARLLYASVENWARTCGCRELASDTFVDNWISQRMFSALQFEETERVVYFRKELRPPRG